MMLALTWADVVFDPETVWQRIQPASPIAATVDRRNLVGCHLCSLLVDMSGVAHDAGAECPRCGTPLHRRKHDALARAFALSVAAIILYIPANLFPAMTIVSLGQAQAATILGGVIELLDAGMAPLAILIFFASVTVPLAKLVGLGYLIWSVRSRSRFRPRDRTRLYRVIAAVGRWSMIDVFVVAILTALVAFGNLATIVPGFGVVSFCAVVILTMFAAVSFDPRLIWDAAGTNDDRNH
jgi:paraquat-inducible protein A